MSDLVTKLYTRPKKDKGENMPRFQVFMPNYVHQADVLYLPEDPSGYKYLLVVVDDALRHVDAEPLKSHSADEVSKAFGKIYRRHTYLKIPKKIEVDDGSEFKGKTLKFFFMKGISVRVAVSARHRMQAIVETMNQTIGKMLFMKMAVREALTGEQNTEWVKDLPGVLKKLNERADKRSVPKPPTGGVLGEGKLLPIGTKVRIPLETPKNVYGERLHGRFRATDQRFDETIRTIMHISLKPGYPPLYLLNDPDKAGKIKLVGYTRNQLQVVAKDESYPDAKEVFGNKKVKTLIEKITGHKMVKKAMQLKVKYRGYSGEKWIPLKTAQKESPKLVQDYLNSLE